MKPVLQALVLAERIYEDRSGKKVIAGTFNVVLIGKTQPSQEVEHPDGSRQRLIPGGTDMGCPAVYVSLTDVVEGTEIILRFVNVSKNQEMLSKGYRIESVDRLATVEIVAQLPPFSRMGLEAGTFSLDVLWKGEILGSHRVRVVDISGPN